MIIDAFIFFNELDLLEIRLHELDPVVDRFLIVEAATTFTGAPKPLHYWENRGRYAAFADKIMHFNMGALPGPGNWEREWHQRNGISEFLGSRCPDIKDDDTVMVSDADELPAPEAVRRYDPAKGVASFLMLHCRGMLNCVGDGHWGGTTAAPWSKVRSVGAQRLRHGTDKTQPIYGGWHFSYMGGADSIRTKVRAYAHQELNNIHYLNDRHLTLMLAGVSDFQHRDVAWAYVPLDGRFPKYLVDNKDKYGHLWRDAEFNEQWIGPAHLRALALSVEARRHLQGAVIEFGCWEGRSTVAIAAAAAPEEVHAVDLWSAGDDLSINHLFEGRDVYGTFLRNVAALTPGNVVPHREDCHAFMARWAGPIKFAHIDAAHDYGSVKRTIEAVKPFLVPGGLLVGDDFETAGLDHPGLDGGVERSVRESCPDFGRSGNQWWWEKKA
jgi:beta-1,4-mannosyl-glycoprotein beta-1,4-N-acetylglucosaminyltransferase